MKKQNYMLYAAFLSLFLLLFSCSRDYEANLAETNQDGKYLLKSKETIEELSLKDKNLNGLVIWNSYNENNKGEIIEVTYKTTIPNKNLIFEFYKDSVKKIYYKIDLSPKNKTDKNNNQSEVIQYRYLNNLIYKQEYWENNKIVMEGKVIKKEKAPGLNAKIVCIDYYWVYSIAGEVIYEEYYGTVCKDDTTESLDPEGGGGGGIGIEEIPIVFLPPNTPIKNILQFLDCLNMQQPANLKVYAQKMFGGNGVGHAFISITQNGSTMTFGFYPKYGNTSSISGPGVMGDDGGHAYTNSMNIGAITPTQLQQIISTSFTYSNSDYSLGFNNCSDFVLDVMNIAGFSIPTSGIDHPSTVADFIGGNSSGIGPNTQKNCH